MITVVLWKWGDLYTADHVNLLSRALKRHLHVPYTVFCITDNSDNLDPDINVFPISFTSGKRNLRRLWIFSPAASLLGSTLLQIDIDMVITGDITPLVTSFTD